MVVIFMCMHGHAPHIQHVGLRHYKYMASLYLYKHTKSCIACRALPQNLVHMHPLVQTPCSNFQPKFPHRYFCLARKSTLTMKSNYLNVKMIAIYIVSTLTISITSRLILSSFFILQIACDSVDIMRPCDDRSISNGCHVEMTRSRVSVSLLFCLILVCTNHFIPCTYLAYVERKNGSRHP